MLNVILRLRRDNDYNYKKVKDTFIPANGEICLVDTAYDGLRAVCGDGKTVFGELPFMNDIIQKGYYKENKFYKDQNFTEVLQSSSIKIYIDLVSNSLFHFDGVNFHEIVIRIPTATAQSAGIMKLYNEVGYNTDGTMSQKAITEELDQKVELELKEEEELIIFSL